MVSETLPNLMRENMADPQFMMIDPTVKKKAGIMLIDISKQEKAFLLNIPRKSLIP